MTFYRKNPCAFEITHFTEDGEIEDDGFSKTSLEIDLVVCEKKEGKIVAGVFVEWKIRDVKTHDAITYSHKAMYHKNVIPLVRYGSMLGYRRGYPLLRRLFRHGTNFDFLFSFVDYVLDEKEKEMFVGMIKKEIEEILGNSRSRERKRYFILQKEFRLGEME